MTEDFKNLRDSLFKTVFSIKGGEGKGPSSSLSLREMIGTLASIAGKGKDEIVQMISREIGLAVAAMLKEPLNQTLAQKKLKITLELVPRNSEKTESKVVKKKKVLKRKILVRK